MTVPNSAPGTVQQSAAAMARCSVSPKATSREDRSVSRLVIESAGLSTVQHVAGRHRAETLPCDRSGLLSFQSRSGRSWSYCPSRTRMSGFRPRALHSMWHRTCAACSGRCSDLSDCCRTQLCLVCTLAVWIAQRGRWLQPPGSRCNRQHTYTKSIDHRLARKMDAGLALP